MSFAAADPVSSGRPYPVLGLGAGAPAELAQFSGETFFTIDKDGAESIICGCGAPQDDGVRFHEKDASSGNDVRTWRISQDSQGHFAAEATATY